MGVYQLWAKPADGARLTVLPYELNNQPNVPSTRFMVFISLVPQETKQGQIERLFHMINKPLISLTAQDKKYFFMR